MATTTLLQRHAGEGETIAEAIRDCLDYGKNPEKTESGKYISAYECDPVTVADEFLLAKASYAAMTGREQKKANDVLCYQIRQSFYTESGATIRVAWNELPSGVQIVITDNGCGIHPEDIHHIFKRFYRSRFSKDKQGIGLGLPLAKAIVEAHNGTIEVDSELGIGTTFTMNFLIPTKL